MGVSAALGSSALLPAGLGFRNVLINGAMNVAQRSTSVASLSSPSGTYNTADRWNTFLSGAGTYTQSQSTDAPTGFGYSLKMQCTTASGALAAGAYGQIQQIIEGQNVQQFAKGTSSAKPFAVSFWVKALQTGTYVVELYDATNTRSVSRTYTVNTAETWEYKTIQFPADATGAFANSNAGALIIVHWFSGGTTYTSGTANGSWAAASNGNRAAGLTVNVGSSTNNYWQVTGVQLEQNYQPTPFEQRPIGTELALCHRYYQRLGNTVYCIYATLTDWTNTNGYGVIKLLQSMRSAPTLDYSSLSHFYIYATATTCNPTSLSLWTPGANTVDSFGLQINGSALTGGNKSAWFSNANNASGWIDFSAEL